METYDTTTPELAEVVVLSLGRSADDEFVGDDLFEWMGVKGAAPATDGDDAAVNAAATLRRLTPRTATAVGLAVGWREPESADRVVQPGHPAVARAGIYAKTFLARVTS